VAYVPASPPPGAGTTVDHIRAPGETSFDPHRTGAYAPPQEPAEAPPPAVPGYEILGELGRGGMGVVYKARHVGLDRLVALKMVLAGAHADTEQLARFHAEAQAVARLHHANIVQIYEIGTVDGLPYFALEFVDGGTLAKKIARTPHPPRFAAETVEALARAVAAAHERGVVHRDLKPANVLLAADGTPKVTDFGLAKRLEGDSLQTRSGTVVGTPSYMSPEQARGDVKDVGPLADVWALGAILYDLLTGRPPFLGKSMLDTLEQVRSQEPVAPTQFDTKVPRDLETICLKCLQKEQARRYAGAGELAADLRRFLNGEPIQARPVSAGERLLRWAKRNPVVAGLSAAVVLGVLVYAVTSTVLAWQLGVQKRAAETARDEEKRAKEQEKAAHEIAEQKAEIAGEQSDRALDAMSFMLVEIQTRLRGEPAAQRLRESLVRLAMGELDKIRASTERAQLGDRRAATAFGRLGDIFLEGGRVQDAVAQY
jgi:hypothetical protein